MSALFGILAIAGGAGIFIYLRVGRRAGLIACVVASAATFLLFVVIAKIYWAVTPTREDGFIDKIADDGIVFNYVRDDPELRDHWFQIANQMCLLRHYNSDRALVDRLVEECLPPGPLAEGKADRLLVDIKEYYCSD